MQIWEEACLNKRPGRRELHYIKAKGTPAPLEYSWDKSKPRNKSAYLWHAGLWSACQESRKVIDKYWEKQPRPLNDEDMYLCCSPEVAERFIEHIWPKATSWEVQMLLSENNHEHWRHMINLEKDIFCVTEHNWGSLSTNCDPWTVCSEVRRVENVAIEFDPSWNSALEDIDDELSIGDIPVPLNFLLGLLFDHVGEYSGDEIRLVTKDISWISETSTIEPTVFDLDTEYVEIPADHSWRCPGRLVEKTPLSEFFDHLERLFHESLLSLFCHRRGIHPDWDTDLEERESFDILSSFIILVRWENRVKDE